jgi:hypothetical protein
MKVKQLIAELQKQNPEAYVTDMNKRGVTQLIPSIAFLEDASTVDAELVLLNTVNSVDYEGN